MMSDIRELLKKRKSHDRGGVDYSPSKRADVSDAIVDILLDVFDPDQLARMIEAGPDRVVVLPCKVGDTVWVISDGEVYECILRNMLTYEAVNYNLEICRYMDGTFEDKQSVFTDPAAAAAALKGADQ